MQIGSSNRLLICFLRRLNKRAPGKLDSIVEELPVQLAVPGQDFVNGKEVRSRLVRVPVQWPTLDPVGLLNRDLNADGSGPSGLMHPGGDSFTAQSPERVIPRLRHVRESPSRRGPAASAATVSPDLSLNRDDHDDRTSMTTNPSVIHAAPRSMLDRMPERVRRTLAADTARDTTRLRHAGLGSRQGELALERRRRSLRAATA